MSQLSVTNSVTISPEVLMQELQGEAVLLDLKTGVYFGLDHVGTRIWQLMGLHPVLSDVVSHVVREFDVDEQRCSEDVLTLAGKLVEQGLISVG